LKRTHEEERESEWGIEEKKLKKKIKGGGCGKEKTAQTSGIEWRDDSGAANKKKMGQWYKLV